jgi:hypothetical protein
LFGLKSQCKEEFIEAPQQLREASIYAPPCKCPSSDIRDLSVPFTLHFAVGLHGLDHQLDRQNQ